MGSVERVRVGREDSGRRVMPTDGQVRVLRVAVVVAMALFAVYYVAVSIHWKLMVDSPILHYVVYLMRHGLRPYVDITDNNMPGAYLTESWAMRVFGAGDLGWRMYEYALYAVMAAAMAVIARPYDWLAGVIGAGMFLLVHGSEGPNLAVEREQVIAVLLVVGYAAMFAAVRRRWPTAMLLFGLALGLAGSIKPTFAPLGLLLLGMAVVALRKRGVPARAYVGWAGLGFLAVAAVMIGFLLRYGVVSQFLFLLRVITPSYVGLNHPALGTMLWRAYPRSLLMLVPIAVALMWLNRGWRGWEQGALWVGAAFGLGSYFLQGKGFLHHRYAWLLTLFLLFGIEFAAGLRKAGWPRVLGCGALLLLTLVSVPHYALTMHRLRDRSVLVPALQRDLTVLGRGAPKSSLDGKVQCFDLVYGCFNALYHLDLVENSGFTGDLLLFGPSGSEATRYYRGLFQERARRDPASVLVVTNQSFGERNSFARLGRWPEFAGYLRDEYVEVVERSFPEEGLPQPVETDVTPPAYRIYVRRGSELMAPAAALR